MMTTSTRNLKILAALVWYIGSIVLSFTGGDLLIEANALKPGQSWPWLAITAGLFFGGLKAQYIFSKSCEKNLDRINALNQPKIWQFFRPGFFALLTVMILIGATLSRMAHNNYPFLIGLAILDISIAIALLGSSLVYWKQKAFAK